MNFIGIGKRWKKRPTETLDEILKLEPLDRANALWSIWTSVDITEDDDTWAEFSNAVHRHLDKCGIDWMLAEGRCRMSNSQWHEDQAIGERALREHKRRSELDSRLGDALRASGINAADALAVQALYATAGQSGSHRIVSALRAVEAWLREGGAP